MSDSRPVETTLSIRTGPPAGEVERHTPAAKLAVPAFLFAAALVVWQLGALPLLDPDEGRNAVVAQEMAASGNWLLPTYNGLVYLDKPALYFGMVAASLRVFGVSEAAARLPSALSALILLGLVYVFARAEYGERPAALSVVVVASMPLYFAFARMVIFDMTLALFVTIAIFAGYWAEACTGTERRRWYLAGAAAAGMATLVKGPVGFLLPALVLLGFAVVERNRGVVRRLLRPLNVAVLSAVVMPWLIAVSLQQPEFPYYALVKESLERFANPVFERSAPFYYYGPVLLAVCFGWILLVPKAARVVWRERASLRRADRFLMTWAVVVVLFFSLSQTKLPGYVLTTLIALGILVGRLFDTAFTRPRGAAAGAIFHGAGLAVAVSGLASAWLLIEILDPAILGSVFDLDDVAYGYARASFPALFATLLTIAAGAAAALVARSARLVFATFLVLPVALLTVCLPGVKAYAELSSSRALAAALDAVAPGATTACLQCFPTGLAFYRDAPICLITVDGREMTSNYIPFVLSQQEQWPHQVISVGDRDSWLEARTTDVVVLANARLRESLDDLAASLGQQVTELPGDWWALVLRAPD